LQPEPLLATLPHKLPTYEYAFSNPLAFVDVTGLEPLIASFVTREDAAKAGFAWIYQNTNDNWLFHEYAFYTYQNPKTQLWGYSQPQLTNERYKGTVAYPISARGICHSHTQKGPQKFADKDRESASAIWGQVLAAAKAQGANPAGDIVFYMMNSRLELWARNELGEEWLIPFDATNTTP
jgi:hypothetical protein